MRPALRMRLWGYMIHGFSVSQMAEFEGLHKGAIACHLRTIRREEASKTEEPNGKAGD